MQVHPRPELKVFDTSRGLEGLAVLTSDLASKLEGWPLPLLVMDFETNGSSAARDAIVEIAAIRVEANREIMFSTILKTDDAGRTDLHGITSADQRMAPTFEQVVPVLRMMAEGATLVSHHTTLDRFVAEEMKRIGGDWQLPYIDSLKVVKAVYPDRKGRGTNTLYNLCDDFGVPNLGYHLALGDVLAVAHLAATLNRAKPVEVAAVLAKVLKRSNGISVWPDLPLPDKLVVAIRIPHTKKEEDYVPVPASQREDFVPEAEVGVAGVVAVDAPGDQAVGEEVEVLGPEVRVRAPPVMRPAADRGERAPAPHRLNVVEFMILFGLAVGVTFVLLVLVLVAVGP